MKTNYKSLIVVAILNLFVGLSITKATDTNDELLPDQNPNYKKSRDKYMSIKDEYTKKFNTTVQQTYKAIDDVQAKKERKELRKERRHERKLARINSRKYRRLNRPNRNYYGYNNYYYQPNPWGYNQYGYWNNNLNFPYSYGYNHYNYNSSKGHWSNGVHVAADLALLGLGFYFLLR